MSRHRAAPTAQLMYVRTAGGGIGCIVLIFNQPLPLQQLLALEADKDVYYSVAADAGTHLTLYTTPQRGQHSECPTFALMREIVARASELTGLDFREEIVVAPEREDYKLPVTAIDGMFVRIPPREKSSGSYERRRFFVWLRELPGDIIEDIKLWWVLRRL